MRTVHVMLFIVLCIYLVVLGCGGEEVSSIAKNYKVGYGDLTITVDEQRSPQVLYQKRPFSQVLVLYNKAGYDLQNVRVTMANYDQTYLSVFNPEQVFPSIEARSAYTGEEGGRADLVFLGDVLDLRDAQERQEKFRLYASYQSKIEFFPTVCVNTAVYNVFDAGCEMPKGAVSFSGQGGPIAITKMEEILIGGSDAPELELRLSLENKGRGVMKKVRLGQARLGNEALACQFREIVENADGSVSFKKDQKQGQVICVKSLPERRSYQTPLFIELFYDYEFSEARQLLVRR